MPALQEGSCPAEIVQADSIRVEAEALGPQTEAPEPGNREPQAVMLRPDRRHRSRV